MVGVVEAEAMVAVEVEVGAVEVLGKGREVPVPAEAVPVAGKDVPVLRRSRRRGLPLRSAHPPAHPTPNPVHYVHRRCAHTHHTNMELLPRAAKAMLSPANACRVCDFVSLNVLRACLSAALPT